MITIQHLSLSFGAQPIFKDLSLSLLGTERIGIVGRNGMGKSTLLKVIGGEIKPDGGTVSIHRDFSVAFLPQEVILNSARSVLQEALYTFAEFEAYREELAEIERKLDHDSSAELVERYSDILLKLQNYDASAVEREALSILKGLGFSDTMISQSVNELSTGWKMRLVLSKLLLQKSAFYLFDEPTNHLDIFAQEWFLSFLKKSDLGFMIVCHERYFLEQLCTHILEVDRGNSTLYTGNYSSYLRQKAEREAHLEAAYVQQQKEIKRKQETIDRFRYTPSKAKMVQSMIKALEKEERIELPIKPAANISISFKAHQKPSRTVLEVKNVSFGYSENNLLFKDVNFEIERGEKVALIAPNGKGKTTLFNILCGFIKQRSGSIDYGMNVEPALFSQEYKESYESNKTILQEIEESAAQQSEQTIRAALGSFLFKKDDIEKPISVLSGGEKNRVRMVKVLLKHANFLLLDEPTNHLDIDSKAILSKALKTYDGTILFVSHDKDFINALATRVLELTEDGVLSYSGNYDDFLYHKKAMAPLEEVEEKPVVKEPQKHLTKNSKKQQRKLEMEMEKCEKAIAQLQKKLNSLSYADASFQKACDELAEHEKNYEVLFKEWENLEH